MAVNTSIDIDRGPRQDRRRGGVSAHPRDATVCRLTCLVSEVVSHEFGRGELVIDALMDPVVAVRHQLVLSALMIMKCAGRIPAPRCFGAGLCRRM